MKRYSRQIVLPEVGLGGQDALMKSRVLCVGAGGLGSPALLYLAAAGVGTLGIVDPDSVDESNLQRQILYGTSCMGSPKVFSARSRIEDLNPLIQVEAFQESFTAQNALSILSRFDVVIDGTDNFSAKFILNDAAAQLKMPLVYGAISGFEGQISVFWKGKGPCYRCLYPYPPIAKIENCAEAGVLGALAGVIGSMQAMEAIKIILSKNQKESTLKPLVGRLLVMDASQFQMNEFQIRMRPECSICRATSEEILLKDGEKSAESQPVDCHFSILPEFLKNPSSNFTLIDVRERSEWERGHIENALHWPLSQLIEGYLPQANDVKTETPLLVLYCQTGVRSLQAMQILRSHGFNAVKHLAGGYQKWLASSDPLPQRACP